MADKILPFGQVTPVARPIGAFVQPAERNIAAPAKPALLGAPDGITAMQMGSGGSVQGFNQYQQLATALSPFTESLVKFGEQGYLNYAQGNIEQGYYEELKNQRAKAALSLQVQKEAGAANAAATIGELQKTDPEGAQLLKDSNPWKQVGRERARAQLAGSEIDNLLADDLTTNGGYLATLQPGSTELLKRKAALTQKVLDKYGLKEDQTETQFYVAPKLNDAWDKYTATQGKLYSASVYQDTVLKTSALAVAGMNDAVQNGLKMPNGTVLKVGSPEWLGEAQRRMTNLLDGQLQVLPPDDRAKAMGKLRSDLLAFSGVPFVWELVTGTRVGNRFDANGREVPYDQRPTWGAAQASELLEDRQKASQRRLDQANNDQAFKRLEAQDDYNRNVARFAPGTAEYTQAGIEFRQRQLAKGFLRVDDFLASATKERETLQGQLFPADPREAASFSTAIKALPANVWTDDPNTLKNLTDHAWRIASRQPTAEKRTSTYNALVADIEKARDQAGKAAKDVVPGAKNAALEDLDSPEVRAIRKKQRGSGNGALGAAVMQAAATGSSVAAAVSGMGDRKLTAAANQLERLYQAAMQNKINAWQATHPNQVLSPEARQNLVAEARNEVRKTGQYGQIMKGLTGKAPTGTPQAVAQQTLEGGRYAITDKGQSFGQMPSTPIIGVSRGSSSGLPDSTVKGYAVRPVLDGNWMREELKRVGQGQSVSPQMSRLAQRAGVNPYRYLQEQLKFYPSMDDEEGSLRQLLQEKAGQRRAAQSISQAQLPYALPGATGGMAMVPIGYNPLAPGSWLMSMIAPPLQSVQSFFGGEQATGSNYVATTGFGYSADGKTQTLHGIRGRSGYDANHGVGNDHVHHGAGDKATALALARFLKNRGWPITEFKPWTRVGAHQDPGHYDGRSFDIPVSTARHQAVLDDINLFYSGGAAPRSTSMRGGGMTGYATWYGGGGGQDGVAGGPTANGETYDPNKMTAAIQWSLRGKYLNKWVTVEDLDTGRTVRVWVNDVGPMGGDERAVNRTDPRVIDLSPAAFRSLFGSTSRGKGRIRILQS
jgi:hypothetical protein